MTPMRIALVYPDFDLGSSLARDRVLLARALVGRGVEVVVYSDPETRTADVPGVEHRDVRPLVRGAGRLGFPAGQLAFARAATVVLRRDRGAHDLIDVSGASAWEHDVVRVHAVHRAEQRRWPDGAGRNYRAARMRAAAAPALQPILAVVRGIERLQFRLGRYRHVTAVSEQVRDDLVALHGVSPARLSVVPYAVELERFAGGSRNGLRERLGVEPGAPLVLFVGHDFERKGLGEAVEAIASLPEAHLAVAGDGDRDAYAAVAERAGAAGRVHFLGATVEPERLFANADVFLLPTRNDVWGIAIVEALAAGVPVVTTEAAGAARVVRTAGAGAVVPDGDPRALREALRPLVADESRRRELGSRGPAAVTDYGLDGFGDAMLAVYERVLFERKASR